METEKRKNTKTVAYLVMFVAFALVVLSAGAYAFYVNDIRFGQSVDFNTTIPKASVFTATSDGGIVFNGSPMQIGQYSVSTNAILSSGANVNVELTSGTDYETTYCSYDLVWTYTSDDMYKEADVTLPHTGTDGTQYPYEFSGMVNGKNETDLSNYIWNDKQATIVGDLVIASALADTATTQRFELLFQLYNIDAEQTNLFDRSFAANVELTNQECFTKTYEAGKHHYFLYDEDTFSYVEQDTVPTVSGGVSPVLDTAITICAKGGSVSNYNASTGTITAPTDDECYIYFTEYN